MKAAEFKKIRKELGYTQEQLATVIGYSRRMIINYENGTHEIDKAVGMLMLFMVKASRKTREEIYSASGMDDDNLIHRSAKTTMEDFLRALK